MVLTSTGLYLATALFAVFCVAGFVSLAWQAWRGKHRALPPGMGGGRRATAAAPPRARAGRAPSPVEYP
jgi:hypothetical protein